MRSLLFGRTLTSDHQKKMNARMKDALDETLILSNKCASRMLRGFRLY